MSGIVSTIDQAMCIPELIEIVKHSFRESEVNEVQRILTDRETKMKTEIENLQKDYVSAKKGAELLEMSQKLAEADKLNLDKEIEFLRRERDALKRQKVEADETLKNYINRFETRMMRLEGALADVFNVKVEDLAALANSVEESNDDTPTATAAAEGDVNSGDRNLVQSSTNAARTSPALQSSGTLPRVEPQVPGDRNLVHSSAKDNGANTSRTSRGSQSGGSHPRVEPQVPGDRNLVHSSTNAARTSPALKSGGTLPHVEPQVPGRRNLVHSSSKDNGANTSRTSRGSQSAGSHPRVEPQVPGDRNLIHSSTNATRTSALRSGGSPRVEPQVPDVTEICDADGETNCDTFSTSLTAKWKRKRSTYISSDEEDENIPINGKEIQDPESTHDRITLLNGAPAKPSTICNDSQTHDISSDSDDDSSCSDEYMNNLISTFQSEKFGRK